VKGFWSRVLRHLFSWKTLIMYRYSMSDLASLEYESHDGGLVFRELAGGDFPAFGDLLATQEAREPVFKPAFDIAVARERLRNGGYCFVCEDGGRIVGYTWFASGEGHLVDARVKIRLDERQAYAYNSYVMHEYRGSNIFRHLLIAGARVLCPRGFTGGLGAAMNWNAASRNILARAGFRTAGHLIVGYFLSFRYLINTCRGLTLYRTAGPFEFYRKLFTRLTGAPGARRRRMRR